MYIGLSSLSFATTLYHRNSGISIDNLAEYYTKQKLPGVGISIGLTRFFDQMYGLGIIKADKKSIADILAATVVIDVAPKQRKIK